MPNESTGGYIDIADDVGRDTKVQVVNTVKDGTGEWVIPVADSNGQLIEGVGGGVAYSKTLTMTDDNATRFETAAKILRDIVIIVQTKPMLLGSTTVEVYPMAINDTVGITKLDISTLYFKNAGAGDNGTISILGVEG